MKNTIEGIITQHKGSGFIGEVMHVGCSVGPFFSNSSDDTFVDVNLLGQKVEIHLASQSKDVKVFIGKKFLVNCTGLTINMSANKHDTFSLELISLPTFLKKKKKKPEPFIFR